MSRNKQKKLYGESINITIYDVPTELVHEFSEYVVKPHYPGGISPAIKDLMRKAVKEEKQRREGGIGHD